MAVAAKNKRTEDSENSEGKQTELKGDRRDASTACARGTHVIITLWEPFVQNGKARWMEGPVIKWSSKRMRNYGKNRGYPVGTHNGSTGKLRGTLWEPIVEVQGKYGVPCGNPQ